ncbi:MAG: DUF2924 domain-containing protein [Candidatus Omnitrophota bacterium]|jgi:hypothetical protein
MNGIMVLKNAPIEELLGRYKELYGDNAAGTHRLYLWRKIAYRLQEREQGTLSTKAKVRLKTLIEEYDPINNKALRPDKPSCLPVIAKDKRLPIPGTVITKEYKDTKYQVKVLEKGFEYTGKIYKTLSAIAKEITGAHWNGYLFFNL